MKTLFKIAVTALLAILPITASADGHAFDLDKIAKVDVLEGWRNADGTHMAAIRIRLAPGWKTYWRAPGVAGIPPSFSWEASKNLKSVQIHWPTPVVFYQNDLRSIGYKNELILPVSLTRRSADDPEIRLKAELEMGVCENICIPMAVTVQATLGAGNTPDPAIQASLDRQPKPLNKSVATCLIEPISDGLKMTASIKTPKSGKSEVAIIELSDQTIWVSETESQRKRSILQAVAEFVPPSAAPFALQRSDIRITILNGGNGLDIQGCTGG